MEYLQRAELLMLKKGKSGKKLLNNVKTMKRAIFI